MALRAEDRLRHAIIVKRPDIITSSFLAAFFIDTVREPSVDFSMLEKKKRDVGGAHKWCRARAPPVAPTTIVFHTCLPSGITHVLYRVLCRIFQCSKLQSLSPSKHTRLTKITFHFC